MLKRIVITFAVCLATSAYAMHHQNPINPSNLRSACLNRYATHLNQLVHQGRINQMQSTVLTQQFNGAHHSEQTFAHVQGSYFALVQTVQRAQQKHSAQ